MQSLGILTVNDNRVSIKKQLVCSLFCCCCYCFVTTALLLAWWNSELSDPKKANGKNTARQRYDRKTQTHKRPKRTLTGQYKTCAKSSLFPICLSQEDFYFSERFRYDSKTVISLRFRYDRTSVVSMWGLNMTGSLLFQWEVPIWQEVCYFTEVLIWQEELRHVVVVVFRILTSWQPNRVISGQR